MKATLHADLVKEAPLPLSEFLSRELAARHLTQADLARRTGLSAKHVNQVMQDKVPLSVEVAGKFERVLRVQAEHLLAWDASARLSTVRAAAREDLTQHQNWLHQFPQDAMRTWGITNKNSSSGEVVEQLLKFFGVATPEAWTAVHTRQVANYKKQSGADEFALALWTRAVRLRGEADGEDLPTYNAEAWRRFVLDNTRQLTLEPFEDAFRQLQQAAQNAGVVALLVPEIKGAKVSGATCWIGGDRPIVAMTPRYKYADSFWFSFAHECGHVLEHPQFEESIDSKDMPHEDRREKQAGTFASRALTGGITELEIWRLTTASALRQKAAELGVHPGQLAGAYGKVTGDWQKFGKVRSSRMVDPELFTPPAPAW